MNNDPMSRAQLREIVLRDLVTIHQFNAAGAEYLSSQWVDCNSFSWVRTPYTMGKQAVISLWTCTDLTWMPGAYAYFGPGQYKTMLRCLTMPGAHGRLHVAGEAVSATHALVSCLHCMLLKELTPNCAQLGSRSPRCVRQSSPSDRTLYVWPRIRRIREAAENPRSSGRVDG